MITGSVDEIDWCFEHANNLHLTQFVEHFHIDNKKTANRRYGLILSSTKFQACPERKKLVYEFNNWKGSQREAHFWAEKEREKQEELARVHLQVDGLKTAAHFALQGGSQLRRSPSSSSSQDR